MQQAEEILEKLKGAKTSLKRRYGVTEVAIFGSYSKGEQQEDSYVELLVNFDKAPGIGFTDLEDELAQLLQKKVDVILRKSIDKSYYKSIKSELKYA